MKHLQLLAVIYIGSLSIGTVIPAKAQVITQWNFNSTVAAPDNSPAPTTGSGTAISLGMTNTYSYTGTTATNSVTSDDILSQAGTADTSFSEYGWRIRGAYQSTGVAPNNGTVSHSSDVNGWNLSAPEYSQGAEFDASTVGYSNINVAFDWYSTTQGIRDLQFQYNLNTANSAGWTNYGGTSPTGTYIATPNDYYNAPGSPTITLNLSSITGASNDATFGIRLVSAYDSTGNLGDTYASASLTTGGVTQAYNNNSGNWRFGNITFSGTAEATPEPESYALALCAAALFSAIHFFRKEKSASLR